MSYRLFEMKKPLGSRADTTRYHKQVPMCTARGQYHADSRTLARNLQAIRNIQTVTF